MTNILVILYTITLIYTFVGSRVVTYIRALSIQGVLLFLISVIELSSLHELHYSTLLFILVETLLFKGIFVPYYIHYLTNKSSVKSERDSDETNFFSLFKIALIFLLSFYVGYKLHDSEFQLQLGYRFHKHTHEIIYFSSALSAIFTGIMIVMNRKKIITLVTGYLVLENGLFLLSVSIGNEMPLVVNIGVLFDILTTVFLLGVFILRLDKVFKQAQVSVLSELHD